MTQTKAIRPPDRTSISVPTYVIGMIGNHCLWGTRRHHELVARTDALLGRIDAVLGETVDGNDAAAASAESRTVMLIPVVPCSSVDDCLRFFHQLPCSEQDS